MISSNSSFATTPSQLGQPQIGSALAQRLSGATGSGGANHQQVAQTDETASACAPTYSSWTERCDERIDGRTAQQSSLDGGFQRLVSHPGWPAGRAVDGTGFVQSICLEHPSAAGPAMATGTADFSGAVWALWLPDSDPSRQRASLWQHRAGGPFAL